MNFNKTDRQIAQLTIKAEVLRNGKWELLQPDMVLFTTIYLKRVKSSEDNGRFIPGVYRTNAYEVVDESVKLYPNTKVITTSKWGNTYRFTYTGILDSGGIASSPVFSIPASVAMLKKEALQKAYSKLGKADFGIGEDLGELRETISMLRDPLSSFRKFLLGKPRMDTGYNNLGKLRDLFLYNRSATFHSWTGKNALKAATDTWLELRYGFRPLIGSIGKVVEAIQSKQDKLFNPNTVRSVRSKRVGQSSKVIDGWTSSTWPGGNSLSTTTDSEYTVRASVQFRQAYELAMIHKLGLSPRYWPETAWELTKLSFVWDWFVSIGPWLETFRYKPEITVLGNTVGTKIVEETRCHSMTMYTAYGDTPGQWPVPTSSSRTRRWYKREVNVDQPLFPVFRCGDVFDIAKTVDSMALTIQSLNKALKKH